MISSRAISALLKSAQGWGQLMVDVRTYVMKADGTLEFWSVLKFDHFGACPNVGDTICYSFWRDRPSYYSVQRRYFIDDNDRRHGWAVILREIENSPQIAQVMKEWRFDSDVLDDIVAEAEREHTVDADGIWERLLQHVDKSPPADFAMDYREENAIRQLAKRKVGIKYRCGAISDFGPATMRKLASRGFVVKHPNGAAKFADEEISLSSAGSKAWKLLQAFRKQD